MIVSDQGADMALRGGSLTKYVITMFDALMIILVKDVYQ